MARCSFGETLKPQRVLPRHADRARVVGLLAFAGLLVGPAHGQTTGARGTFAYISRQACISAGKFSSEICTNAQINAEAEFEEKAPHLPTRAACEQAFGVGQCAISFRQISPTAGAKSNVSFTIRQQGFRIVARSDTDVTTIPVARDLNFSPRSAIYRRTSIDPRAAGKAAPAKAAGPTPSGFGVSEPTGGVAGPLPPPVPNDPNFNCADFIEPSSKGDPRAACAPAPKR